MTIPIGDKLIIDFTQDGNKVIGDLRQLPEGWKENKQFRNNGITIRQCAKDFFILGRNGIFLEENIGPFLYSRSADFSTPADAAAAIPKYQAAVDAYNRHYAKGLLRGTLEVNFSKQPGVGFSLLYKEPKTRTHICTLFPDEFPNFPGLQEIYDSMTDGETRPGRITIEIDGPPEPEVPEWCKEAVEEIMNRFCLDHVDYHRFKKNSIQIIYDHFQKGT